MWLRGLVLGVDPPDLPHAPLHGLVDARAARHAREHVGDDERGEHLLRGGRHRPGVAEERCDLVLLLERPELRVLPEPRHRLVVPAAEARHVVAAARPQERTSGVMPSSYSALAKRSASRVSFESSSMLCPDASVSLAPKQ